MPKRLMTIERHIIEQQKQFSLATGEFSALLYDIAFAAKVISRDVRKARLGDILGYTGSENVQGEQKLPGSIKAEKKVKIQFSVFAGTWLELPREELQIGQRSQQLRILSERLEENRFVFVCEGVGGKSYDLILHSPREVASVNGGELVASEKLDIVRLKFTGSVGEYETREISVNFEK